MSVKDPKITAKPQDDDDYDNEGFEEEKEAPSPDLKKKSEKNPDKTKTETIKQELKPELKPEIQPPEAAEKTPQEQIELLKQKNAILKEKIKELNETIKDNAERDTKLKLITQKSSKNVTTISEVDRLRKENTSYIKEIQSLTSRLKQVMSLNQNDRVAKLETLLRQKEKDIDQLVTDKKVNDKLRRDSEKSIETLKQEKQYYYKVAQELNSALSAAKKAQNPDAETIALLKEKIIEYDKKVKEDKKLIKQQLNVILAFDDRYKQLCAKAGLTPNPLLDQSKLNDFYRRKYHDVGENVDKLNKLFDVDEMSDEEDGAQTLEQRYQKLQRKYQDLLHFNDRSSKKLKTEVDFLINKLNDSELIIREKEKEVDLFKDRSMILKKNVLNKSRVLLAPLPDGFKGSMLLDQLSDSPHDADSPEIKGKKENGSRNPSIGDSNVFKQELKKSTGDQSATRSLVNADKKDADKKEADKKEADKPNEGKKLGDTLNSSEVKLANSEKPKAENTSAINSKTDLPNLQSPKDVQPHLESKNTTPSNPENKATGESKISTENKASTEHNASAENKASIENKAIAEIKSPTENKAPADNKQPTSEKVPEDKFISKIHLGLITEGTIEPFDDLKENVNQPKSNKIHALQIWCDHTSIVGIQVTYKLDSGLTHTALKHASPKLDDKHKKDLVTIEEDDQLKKVSGIYDPKFGIIMLEFTTKKGLLLTYGKHQAFGTEFTYDFKSTEKPTYVLGTFIKVDGGSEGEKLALASIGFRLEKVVSTVVSAVVSTK